MNRSRGLKAALLVLTVLIFGIASFFVACYPGDELTISDTDIVTTFFSKSANFATKMTYARPNSVVRIVSGGIEIGSPPYDDDVMNRIDQNMTALGFTMADSSTADVVVGAAVATATWTGGSCYPGYWGWYGYPGWGWCYPVTYTYETGTLIIVMWDRTQGSNQEALWVAGMNGLIQGSVATSRITSAIDQAFNQSPYLGDGK